MKGVNLILLFGILFLVVGIISPTFAQPISVKKKISGKTLLAKVKSLNLKSRFANLKAQGLKGLQNALARLKIILATTKGNQLGVQNAINTIGSRIGSGGGSQQSGGSSSSNQGQGNARGKGR